MIYDYFKIYLLIKDFTDKDNLGIYHDGRNYNRVLLKQNDIIICLFRHNTKVSGRITKYFKYKYRISTLFNLATPTKKSERLHDIYCIENLELCTIELTEKDIEFLRPHLTDQIQDMMFLSNFRTNPD